MAEALDYIVPILAGIGSAASPNFARGVHAASGAAYTYEDMKRAEEERKKQEQLSNALRAFYGGMSPEDAQTREVDRMRSASGGGSHLPERMGAVLSTPITPNALGQIEAAEARQRADGVFNDAVLGYPTNERVGMTFNDVMQVIAATDPHAAERYALSNQAAITNAYLERGTEAQKARDRRLLEQLKQTAPYKLSAGSALVSPDGTPKYENRLGIEKEKESGAAKKYVADLSLQAAQTRSGAPRTVSPGAVLVQDGEVVFANPKTSSSSAKPVENTDKKALLKRKAALEKRLDSLNYDPKIHSKMENKAKDDVISKILDELANINELLGVKNQTPLGSAKQSSGSGRVFNYVPGQGFVEER